MNRLVRALAASALAAAMSPALAQDKAQNKDYMGGFDGRWEGPLKSIAPQAYDPVHGKNLSDDMALAITVKDGAVSVFTGNSKGNWTEVKPGHFEILALKTNATISSIDSSNEAPDKSGWVETWNISATHTDRDHLLVAFTRQVNNYNKPDGDRSSAPGSFMTLGLGELHRAGP